MGRWWLNLLVVAAVIGAGITVVSVIRNLNEPSPFVVSSVDPQRRPIVVEVDGAVVRPGVYELQHGARLGDLLQAAGGLTADADPALVNDALRLEDGALVFIPAEGEPVASSAELVDINTATLAELDTLPDIGPVRAEAIIASRESDGRFETIDDLVLRDVISPALFEQIRDLIAVSN